MGRTSGTGSCVAVFVVVDVVVVVSVAVGGGLSESVVGVAWCMRWLKERQKRILRR